MSKEFHITYSCELIDESAKFSVTKIQRLMKEGGAEFISKNDDYDGFMDIVFHHNTSQDQITKLCNKIIDTLKTQTSYVSVSVYEHQPSVLIDTKDAKDQDAFKSFVEKVSSEHGGVSVKVDAADPSLLRVDFSKSSERQSFQNDFTAKAGEQMKNGHSSVNIYPDWEDITILQKNTYKEEPKKSPKYGY
jgi:hypothetical protein